MADDASPSRKTSHFRKEDWERHFHGVPVIKTTHWNIRFYYTGWEQSENTPTFHSESYRNGNQQHSVSLSFYSKIYIGDGAPRYNVWLMIGNTMTRVKEGRHPIPLQWESTSQYSKEPYCRAAPEFLARVDELSSWTTLHRQKTPPGKSVETILLCLARQPEDKWLPPEMVELLLSFWRVVEFLR